MSIIKPLDIYLDFTTKDIVNIPCTQYDRDGRTLNVHFLDNGKIFLLDKTIHELKFKMTKKDSKIIFNSCTINDDGTATYVLTEQTCVFSGVYDIQFMLINISDESVIHTMPAKLNISKTVADNIQIESSDEFNALNEIFFRVGDLEDLPEKLENLSQGIVDETTRAIAKETEIETKLNQEITRTTSKEAELEKTLSDKIDKTTIATSSTLGLVKSGSDVTVDASGNMSINDNSHKHTVSNISDLTVTANELNVLDGIASTTEELNSTKGVTSNIQEQLNSKVSNERTVNGKSLSANINLTADDVGADVSGSAKAVQNNLDNHINNSDIHFTSEERTKLKGIAEGATKVTVDSTLSSTSTNPVQNKVVNSAIANEVTARDSAIATAKSSAISTAASDATSKADKALASAKSYTDTKTASLASTTVVDNKISTHNTSTSAHSDIRNLISELTTRLNALADSDDTTLDQMSEIVAYIKANKTLIDSVTTNKVNISDIVNNLTTNVSNKPLSAAQGVVIKGLIDVLQSEVDSKANSTDLTSHTGNTSIHVTASEKTAWNNKSDFSGSYNDLINKPTIPTKTSQLTNDSGFKTTDTVTTVTTTGTGNAITSLSATNGAITATKGSTFLTSHPTVTKGTDSTSTASPSAGGTFTAIDSVTRDDNGHVTKVNTKTITLPNTSVVVDSALSSTSTNPVQNKVVNSALAGKASSNHTHSTLDGLTATIAELNYCDGVTSNIQTQLNNKSSAGHTHDVSYISGVLPVSKGGTGQANANSAANALMNALSIGESDPQDADYFISQYAGGGTTNTTYHRRPISALWNYIKSKADSVYAKTSHGNHVPTTETANNAKFLRNDNTWQTVTPANIGAATSSHTHSNYVNQNAFSNVSVGSTTISADTTTDTLTLTAGSNVTITPDATNDKITISSTNTTYNAATTSAAGLMSASDKSKLDGITASADAVSVTQKLTSGTEIGTVTVNGTGTKLYAPTNTDTHYTSKNVVGSSTATSNTTTALTNGNVYLNSVENGAVTSTHKISGSGATTVTTDASGNIVISSTDTNTNTDTKATQINTTTSADYRVVLSRSANDTTETNTLRKSANFTANPSTGAFYAKGYDRIDITGQTLDINTLTLSTGSPEIMRYIEKTSGGSANITNIPVVGNPFILDVELIRWASASDYITKQTFVSTDAKANEYVRYCTNGTWDTSWTKRVFTDNNTTYSAATQSANGLMSAADKKKLDGIATGANNYTYTLPTASSSTLGGVKTTSTVTSTSGLTACPIISGVPYYKDANTTYTHPNTSGNKHIPSGGSSGQILRWSADGTAVWGADNNTTYSAGTGISISDNKITNSGVRSISSGSTNGTISVNTNGTATSVAVKGLGSAAYTASSAYAKASHTHSYLPLSGGTFSTDALINLKGNNGIATGITFNAGNYQTVIYPAYIRTPELNADSANIDDITSMAIFSGEITANVISTNDTDIRFDTNILFDSGYCMRFDDYLGVSYTTDDSVTEDTTLLIGDIEGEDNNNGYTRFTNSCIFSYSVQSSGGAIQFTSDRNMKHDINATDERYIKLFDALKPQTFKYNNGTSNRSHIGYIAQDVEKAINDSGLSSDELGIVCKLNDVYSLRYDEIFMLYDLKIRQLETRINELEKGN